MNFWLIKDNTNRKSGRRRKSSKDQTNRQKCNRQSDSLVRRYVYRARVKCITISSLSNGCFRPDAFRAPVIIRVLTARDQAEGSPRSRRLLRIEPNLLCERAERTRLRCARNSKDNSCRQLRQWRSLRAPPASHKTEREANRGGGERGSLSLARPVSQESTRKGREGKEHRIGKIVNAEELR